MTLLVLLGLAAGLALGTVAAISANPLLQAVALGIEPIGTMWTSAIRMTVIPLVVALVITGVASQAETGRLGRLGGTAVVTFLALLIGGGALAALVTPLLLAGLQVPPEVAAGLRANAEAAVAPPIPSLTQRVLDIVPSNPFRAAADGAMLPLVGFTLLFALALTRLARTDRDSLIRVFQAIADATFVLVRWVLAVAPLGIFALAAALAARMGAGAAAALVRYIVTLSAVMVLLTAAYYPLAGLAGRVSVRRFAAAAAPAQAVGLSARSSLAALPALIAGARHALDASPTMTGFTLPVAVSILRANVPAVFVVGAMFLGRLYGVPLDAAQISGLIATSALLSFSSPGIPSGSLFLLAPLLVGLGIPGEGVGILIALDAIPDMFKTVANTTGHLTAAVILERPQSGIQL